METRNKNIKKLTLLHSNDMHGDFLAEHADGKLVGGVSMLSGYIQKVRAEEKNVLYTISGDMLKGSVIDSEYKGLSTVEIMNMLTPDVATLGNHEADYGFAHLLFLEKCARFPIINANIYLKTNNSRLFKSHKIIKIDGMNILFIGVLTEDILAQARQEKLIGDIIDVHEAAAEVSRVCNAFKTTDIDLTVLLTHVGFEKDKELATALDPRLGVDLIIGGHTHTKMEKPCVVAGIPIVQAECGTDQIGRFDIAIDTDNNRIDSYTWKLIPIDHDHCPTDSDLEELLNKYVSATEHKYSRYITRFANKYTHPARDKESDIGKIFSDILKESLGLDIMLLASGSLRLPELGPIITLKDLNNMIPFKDEVFQISVTGKQFKEMIDHLFRPEALEDDHSEFYQFSKGVQVVISIEEKSVKKITFNEKPIDDSSILNIGLQGYHYRNRKEIFNLDEEKSAGKLLATDIMEVLDENMSKKELIFCPEDKRWIKY